MGSHIFDVPPEGAADDWTVPQDWEKFTDEDHQNWKSLISRASDVVGLATESFGRGLASLGLQEGGIPDYRVLNPRLKRDTGWEVVAVPGLIPNEPFFRLLSQRRFPAANFLRSAANSDYNDEPDMFHDVFGHLPMLYDRAFAEFMVAYGRAGLRAEALGGSDLLGRLYLHTVEFGLVNDDEGLRAFGAGMLSSFAETKFAVTSPEAKRIWFDLRRVMLTDYFFDEFQPQYFVIESFDALLEEMETTSLKAVYEELAGRELLKPGEPHPSDRVFHLEHA